MTTPLRRAPIALLLLWALGLTACGAQDDSTADASATCEDAAAHASACLERDIPAASTCNPDDARRLLDTDCGGLRDADSAAKADGFCNPWLWWTCVDGDDDTDEQTDSSTLAVRVDVCRDDDCDRLMEGVQCARVTLETPAGDLIAAAYTGPDSRATFEGLDLEPGDYELKLWNRDDQLVEQMVEEDFAFGYPGRAPAAQAVTLGSADAPAEVTFRVDRSVDYSLQRCAKLRTSVYSTCQGEPMATLDAAWGWIARLDGVDERGPVSAWARPYRVRDLRYYNSVEYARVYPGEYTLTLIEVDLPDAERDDDADLADLAQRWATGREVQHPVAVAPDDVPLPVRTTAVDVDHQACQ